jgi:hypothetical protein
MLENSQTDVVRPRSHRIGGPQAVATFIALCVLLLLSQVAGASGVNPRACPNELSPGFRSYLPDCRGYELVTPPYKEAYPVVIEAVSKDGEQLLAHSFGTFSEPEDQSPIGTVYGIKREASGWKSSPLEVSASQFPSFGLVAISPDFGSSLVFATVPSRPAVGDVYHGTPLAPFAYVGPGGPPTAKGRVLNLAGASRDLSHSLFFVEAPNTGEESELWPGDGTVGERQPSLYEYDARTANSEPRLVGVSNDGPVSSIFGASLISRCGTSLGGARSGAYDAISENGETIFFTALGRDANVSCAVLSPNIEPAVNELYARVGASQTVAISEPDKANCGECSLSSPADAEFQGASLDSSKVFFTTTQPLLPGAVSGVEDLYEYDFDGSREDHVSLISTGDLAGGRVRRVVRVSADGSHVYFLAQGVLATAANRFGKHAEENAENLYVYERDAAHPNGNLTFIGAGDVQTGQATPDGRFLVFESTADFTPDEGEQIEAGQVFEYDTQTNTLIRVSQGQGGYNEDGNSSIYRASIPTQNYTRALPTTQFTNLAVSEDGAYVFFTSNDSLTPQALSGVVNVYEYHEGQVALISDGHDLARVLGGSAVELLGTDESGRDVFFRTADQLLPEDTDRQLDVYDARSEGGFPSVPANAGCLGDPCQGPLANELAPAPLPTSSLGAEGPVPRASEAPAHSKPTHKRPNAKVKKKHRKTRRKHAHKAKRERR